MNKVNFEKIMSYKKKKKLFMEHFYENIDEEFVCPNLYKSMVYKFYNGGKFIEIGTEKGKGVAFMGVEIVNTEKQFITSIDCIGDWKNIENFGLTKFLNQMKPIIKIINPVMDKPREIVGQYIDRSINFIFFGPTKNYKSLEIDLELWFPKIKLGGIIAGRITNTETHEFIKEFFNEKNLNYYESEGCWIYENNVNFYPIEFDPSLLIENDHSFWAVIFENLNGEEIYREDLTTEDLKNLKITSEGTYKIWRSIKNNLIPHKCIVWPYSSSKGWLEKIEYIL